MFSNNWIIKKKENSNIGHKNFKNICKNNKNKKNQNVK